MLKIERIDGLFYPVVTCDQCGEQIERAGSASALFERDAQGAPTSGHLYFVHRGPCDRAFEAAHPIEGQWAWEDLEAFVYRLGLNLRIDWGRADAKNQRRAEIEASA